MSAETLALCCICRVEPLNYLIAELMPVPILLSVVTLRDVSKRDSSSRSSTHERAIIGVMLTVIATLLYY